MENIDSPANSFEKKEPTKIGISFETPLGKVFKEIDLNFPINELTVFEAFPDRKDLKEIIRRAKDFKMESPGTFNGVLLGNPVLNSMENGKLEISAERLHYFVYFAAHEIRKENPSIFNEQYGALSICGLVYDKARNSFYLSVRPVVSQEEGGKIDAPGGVLNPDFKGADPFDTARDRFMTKLGLDIEHIVSVGVERIFDEHYSLHNIAMYGEVDNQIPKVKPEQFAEIKIEDIEGMLESGRLTSPAKASLLLTLAQSQFTEYGWDHERIKALLERINKTKTNVKD